MILLRGTGNNHLKVLLRMQLASWERAPAGDICLSIEQALFRPWTPPGGWTLLRYDRPPGVRASRFELMIRSLGSSSGRVSIN